MVMGPSRAMKVAVAMAGDNCIHKQGFELLRCCSCVYGIQKKENLWFRMAFIPPLRTPSQSIFGDGLLVYGNLEM